MTTKNASLSRAEDDETLPAQIARNQEVISANEMRQIRAMEFPDLERTDGGDSLWFCGRKEALRATGLIPNGTAFPDECDAKKGVRWRSSTGRRFVLSKGGACPERFRLTVHATPEERRQYANDCRVHFAVKEIDQALRTMDVSEQAFRESMRRFIPAGWRAVRDQKALQEVWTYAPEVLSAIQERFDEIHMLLSAGEVMKDAAKVDALIKRKSALQDKGFQRLLAGLPVTPRV